MTDTTYAGRGRRSGAVLSAIVIISTAIVGAPSAAIAASTPAPFVGKVVPGHHIAALGKSAAAASSTSAAPLLIDPPSAAVMAVTLSGGGASATAPETQARDGGVVAKVTGGWQEFGSTGISFAQASAPKPSLKQVKGKIPRRPHPIGDLSVSLLSAEAASHFGLRGVVLELSRADGSAVKAPLAVKIQKSVLTAAYGADYAGRARWIQVPVHAKPSTKLARTTNAMPVASMTAADAVVLTPQLGSEAMLLTPLATPTSATGTGSFAATPLKPSSTWDVSAQTGDFSWSYPMRTPPAAAGPSPSLALQYDSQSVDGESGSTNNQPSAVGEGWDISAGGFIERSYVSCSQDNGSGGAVAASGDLCWKTDNATISVAGHSGHLVKDQTTGVWKLESDDGSRVEHLVGAAQGCAATNDTYDDDCWRMTTTDGTQYYFGLNQLPGWSSGKATTNSAWTVPVFGNDSREPCHASTFASSSCAQAWRWNLDYVVDPHGNAEALYYNQETNKYSRDGSTVVTYTRGGQLDHIDYGLTASSIYATNAASDRVVFGYDSYGRCSDATHANCTAESLSGSATAPAHPSYYPDAPFDQLCTGSTCPNLLSPTFWTMGMLSTVTTQYLTAGSYATVDVWALGHSFPDPGDLTNAALWLTQITHTGYSGGTSLSEPATTFSGTTMQNRVWAVDGLAPLDKYRISSIHNSTGGVTSVNYATADCTTANAAAIEAAPESNTYRCYPQWWTPDTVYPQPAQEDLFNKFVVTSVIDNPETGGGNDPVQETDYVYTGSPAWRYDTSPFTPDSHRTWSVYAGYSTMEVRVGSSATPSTQQTTAYTFYQGLDGDRAAPSGGTKSVAVTGSPGVADSLWFAGQTRETRVLNGVAGAVISDTVMTPWASPVTANDGTRAARFVKTGDVLTMEPVSTGGSRTTETVSTFDSSYGLPLTVNVITSDAGTSCTTTSYTAPDTSSWLIGYPKEVAKVGVDCAQLSTAMYPDAAISDSRMSYDGSPWGTAPTEGDVTQSQIVDSYSGTTAATAHWVTDSQSGYDAMGRLTSSTDILGHTTTTAYTPAASATAGSGALTQQVTTNTAPFNWTTTTKFNPAWGVETSAEDQNGNATTASYDALGRRTQVWLPIRPQAANPASPSIKYAYTESITVANTIATTTVGPAANITAYVLYDGLGRQVQSQTTAAAGGGSAISDIAYDSAGRVVRTNNLYWTTATPSTALFVPTSQAQIASATATDYDGVGRPTATILNSFGTERYRTATSYVGADRVDVTPPSGGTPTSTFSNSLKQTTKLVQYLAATPDAAATQEATTYSYNPQGKMIGMTDPVGNHWSWGFDVLGRQISAVDPDTGTTMSSYDLGGNLLTSTDGRGTTLAYTYDSLSRKTAQYAGLNSTAGSLLASWQYDTLEKGQLTSSSSYIGSTPGTPGAGYTEAVTGYNAAYEPTGTTVSIPTAAPAFGGTSYSTAMTYAADGSIALQSHAAEGGLPTEKIKYKYAATGQLLGIAGTSVILSTINYTAIGQVSQYARTGGTVTDYSDFGYDPATGAVKENLNQTFVGATSAIVSDDLFSYDDAGNITAQKTSADSMATDTQCYNYDPLRDLTAAWTSASNDCSASPSSAALGGPAPYWTSYTVDPATGNRLTATQNPIAADGTATTDTYTYPAAASARPHAVQSVTHVGDTTTTDTYGYDASGGTTVRPGQSLSYDASGRLSTVTSGGVVQSNVYDASGSLLLQSDSSNGATLFLGDTELHIAAGSTVASAVRTYAAGGTPVAERDTTAGVSGSVLKWLVADQQNNTTAEVDAATGAVTRRFVDPYGNSRGTAVVWSSSHGFLNAPTSALSSLTLLGAREYDPSIGKFLSVDAVLAPLNPQQNNGYSYAQNNPVTLSDPAGTDPAPAASCITLQCRNQSYGGNTPAAAGNNVPLSPHVLIAKDDPRLPSMKAAYRTYVSENGVKINKSAKQEMAIWFQVCALHMAGEVNCGAFGAQVFTASTAQDGVENTALLSSVFFLGTGSNGWTDSSLDLSRLTFAQRDYGETFSKRGKFAGLTVDELASQIKSGEMPLDEVQIDVVVRDRNLLVANTRSSQALIRAGVPVSSWNIVNRTGDSGTETRVSGQLARNGLTTDGFGEPISRGGRGFSGGAGGSGE